MARLTRRKRRLYESILSGKINNDFPYFWYPAKILKQAYNPSKKHVVAWYALIFAKAYGNKEDVDIKKLESLVARSGCAYIIYLWAMKLPHATNIKRFQKEIILCGTHHELRVFADNVPGANKKVLNDFAMVKEVMESV